MTIMEMLGQSVVLTVLGMGIVFVFLIIMVIVINQTGRLIGEGGSENNPALPAAGPVNAESDRKITAAITAGIAEYRKSQ